MGSRHDDAVVDEIAANAESVAHPDNEEGGGHWSPGRAAWNEAVEGIEPHRPTKDVESVDPVRVDVMWQAACDSCGWHTQPASPKSAVREWARLHRVTCPLKPAPELIDGGDA